MGSGMHPAAVVGFHPQGVDEGFDASMGFEVFDEAVLIHPSGQRQNIGWIAKSCQSLKIGQQLRMKGLIGNPTDLGTLHGVPKPHSCFVLSGGCGVVCQTRSESPSPHVFNRDWLQVEKVTQLVVGQHCLCGDGCTSTHEFCVGGVLTSTKSSELSN